MFCTVVDVGIKWFSPCVEIDIFWACVDNIKCFRFCAPTSGCVSCSIRKRACYSSGHCPLSQTLFLGRKTKKRCKSKERFPTISVCTKTTLLAYVFDSVGPVLSVISEDSSLGACWAMAGASGRVTIQLAHEITVESVTVEHVSRLVSLESSSAPQKFQVCIS